MAVGFQLASGGKKKQDSPLHGFNGVFLQKYFTRPDAEMMQHINFVFLSRMFEGGGPTVTANKEFSKRDSVRPRASLFLSGGARR